MIDISTFTFRGATTWTVVHNFGVNPACDIQTYQGGVLTETFPASMTYPDLNTIVITFSTAQTGTVRVIAPALV